MFEPWPDEPDEPEVERRWGNPERDLPRIPEVSTGETDVDPHVLNTFWVSVIFANVALFGVSLGAMLWYFRGQALLGGGLLVTGILAGARTYVVYRRFKTEGSEEQSDDTEPSERSDDGDSRDSSDSSEDTHDAADERGVDAEANADPDDTEADADLDEKTDSTANTVERNG